MNSTFRANLLILTAPVALATAQTMPTLSEEYVRLGGQIIAIENAVTTPFVFTSPSNLAYDTQFVATTGSEILTVTNTGYAPLIVTSARLSGTVANTKLRATIRITVQRQDTFSEGNA